MARKRRKKQHRGAFWFLVILSSLALSFAALVTISERMDEPFLPSWDELYRMLHVVDSPESAPALDTELRIDVIDVGNADSILVRNQDKSLLIDAGENEDGDTVVNYLKAQGIGKLDYVMATHADADHIGGMAQVVESFDIDTFIMAFMPEGHTPTTKTYENLLNALAEKDMTVTEAKPGVSYALGEAVLDILGPVRDFEETNNQSVVCRITFGTRKFLFMGDAEKEAEEALMEAVTDLSADFLKLGHHGSSGSTQEKFLDRVSPRYAVITCGAGNPYGHPNEKTLERLESRDIAYYRSDLNGTVVITCDGNDIRITPEKGAA